MRAYVQRVLEGDASYLNLENIAYWFRQNEYEVVRFDYPEICDGIADRWLTKFPDETVVAGGVGTVRDALKRAGRTYAELPSLPDSLAPWVRRKHWTTTFGAVRSLVEQESGTLPIHIKPLHHQKLFTGRVVERQYDLVRLGEVKDDELLIAQELVDFASEWRAYILRGRIVGVFHYQGEPLQFPDVEDITVALTAFVDAPVAYSMDWGLTTDGDTLLVEVNDGVALGNYGLDGKTYTRMIEARWRELMGYPDYGDGRSSNARELP